MESGLGRKGEKEKRERRRGNQKYIRERNHKRGPVNEEISSTGGEVPVATGEKRLRLEPIDIIEQCKERVVTIRRRGREAELHRREVRERKEREKCEREITLKLDKKKAGIMYWKEKFSKIWQK